MTAAAAKANIHIHMTRDEGCVIQCGADRKEYTDPYQAREENADFREAYKRLLGGVNAILNGKLQPTDQQRITPFCRALAGIFSHDGQETQLAIFTEYLEDNLERTLAVQVTFRNAEGHYVDFYSRNRRQGRLFDQFVASATTFFSASTTENS